MNRETFIAIFLGFAGGILVAFLLIAVPKKLPQVKKTTLSPTPQQEQKPSPENGKFTIISPENNAFIETVEVEIIGTGTENTQVVINGPSDDKVVTIGKDGKFSGKVSIYTGENLLNITAYSKDNSPVSKQLTVFALNE